MFLAVAAVLSPVLSWAEEEGQAITEAPPVSEGQAPSSGAPEAAAVAEASHEEDYLIGPGDALDISVWKDEALTRSCVVRPDGMISFPLLGELRAADRTLAELRADIQKRLSTDIDFSVSGEIEKPEMFFGEIKNILKDHFLKLRKDINRIRGSAYAVDTFLHMTGIDVDKNMTISKKIRIIF